MQASLQTVLNNTVCVIMVFDKYGKSTTQKVTGITPIPIFDYTII